MSQFLQDLNQELILVSLDESRKQNARVATFNAAQMADLKHRLTSELQAIGGVLDSIHEDIQLARQTQQDQLDVFNQILTRDTVQSKLEEFIYQFQKSVNRCSAPDNEYPAITRLLVLRRLLGQCVREGIDTPIIRGIPLKSSFEETRDKAIKLCQELEREPDVTAAIEWTAQNEQRLREEQERQRAKARAEAKEERRKELKRLYPDRAKAINELNARIRKLKRKHMPSFQVWFQQRWKLTPKKLLIYAFIAGLCTYLIAFLIGLIFVAVLFVIYLNTEDEIDRAVHVETAAEIDKLNSLATELSSPENAVS